MVAVTASSSTSNSSLVLDPKQIAGKEKSKVEKFMERNGLKALFGHQRAFVHLLEGRGLEDRSIAAFLGNQEEAMPQMERNVFAILEEGRRIAKGQTQNFADFDSLVADLEEDAPKNVYAVLREVKKRCKGNNPAFIAHLKTKLEGLEREEFQSSFELGLKEENEEPEKQSSTCQMITIGFLGLAVLTAACFGLVKMAERRNASRACVGDNCPNSGAVSDLPNGVSSVVSRQVAARSQVPFQPVQHSICQAPSEWQRHSSKKVVLRAIEKMKNGSFGQGYVRRGDANKTPQEFYSLPFAVLVSQIQESGSYEEFCNQILPQFKALIPNIKPEFYQAVKEADLTQLDQVLGDPYDLLGSPNNDQPQSIAMPLLNELYYLFRLNRDGYQDDRPIQEVFYSTAEKPEYRVLYKEDRVDQILLKTREVSSLHHRASVHRLSTSELQKEVERVLPYLTVKTNLSIEKDQLLNLIEAPRFHLISADVRAKFLSKATRYDWRDISSAIFQSGGAENLPQRAIQNTLEDAAMYRNAELVKVLQDPRFAAHIDGPSFQEALLHVARYERTYDETPQGRTPQIQTIQALKAFPHYAQLNQAERTELGQDIIRKGGKFMYPEVREALPELFA